MDLKSLISKPNTETQESFWSITIEPQWVVAAIWKIENDAVKIIAFGPSSHWDSEEELLAACDTALSATVQNLPTGFSEPTKTVFGVTSSWVSGGNIKDEYLEELKEICQKLSLEPSGFVVMPEAVAHYIKVEEGSPLTGVTLGLSEELLEVSLFKLGRLSGTTSVSRSVAIVDDLTEGLVRFGTEETFPSRIIIYNSKDADLENARQSLTEASWNEGGRVKFLHTPKVEVLSPENKVMAISLAGAAEMAGVTKFLNYAEVENVISPDGNLTAQDLGFSVEEDQQEIQKASYESVKQETQAENIVNTPPAKSFNVNLPKVTMSAIKSPFVNNQMNLNKNALVKPLIIGIGALLSFLIIGFVFWWTYPKANVTIFISPKKLDETIAVALGSDIKTESVEASVSADKTKSTTGTKTVGDKAKGSVKIQNGTSFPINLTAGTILTSSSDLKFTISQTASVSAALTPTSPGTATVDVTASTIGSEYNLAKDEVFKVGNYPKADVDAITTSDFSGGSSRQISAVAEVDVNDLKKELTDELLTEAKRKISEKISGDKILIESLMKTEVEKEEFSNKSGDEATTLKLSMELKVSAQIVAKMDLMKVTSKVMEGKIPSGFVLRDDQVSYKFKSLEESGEDKLELGVTANLLPSIDPIDVAKKLVGKYPSLAESYLRNIPGFVRAEFKIIPSFPGKLGTLPHLSKRIYVEFSADK